MNWRKLAAHVCTVCITVKKNSEREHDDINDANETNGESNKQEMHTDAIPIFVLNR